MSDARLRNFLEMLGREITDASRVRLIRERIGEETLSAEQAGRMIGTLYFEQKKMEALRVLYKHIVDPETLMDLSGQFTFRIYRDQLADLAFGERNQNPE